MPENPWIRMLKAGCEGGVRKISGRVEEGIMIPEDNHARIAAFPEQMRDMEVYSNNKTEKEY